MLMGIDCHRARQWYFVNATVLKDTYREIRAVGTKESSSFKSLAYEVSFLSVPKSSDSKGSII